MTGIAAHLRSAANRLRWRRRPFYRRQARHLLLAAATTAPAVLGASGVYAANDLYIGPSGNWSDGGNWSLGAPPKAGDAANLTAAVGNGVVVTLDPAALNKTSLSNLTIDAPAGASVGLVQAQGSVRVSVNEIVGATGGGSVSFSGGTQTIGDNLLIADGSTAAAGAYVMSGGTLAIANFSYLGNRGTGRFTQSGGSQSVGQTLSLAHFKGATGIFTLEDGATLVVHAENVGEAGVGIFNQYGGTHIVGTSAASAGFLNIAPNSGAVGTYTLAGGTLKVTGNESIGTAQSNGTFQQSGGSHSISGTLTITGAGGTAVGVVNLNGGTLSASAITNGGVFTFGGGTLLAGQSFTNNGTMILSGPGERLISAAAFSIGERGRVEVDSTTARFTGPFTDRSVYVSQGSDNYFTDLIVTQGNPVAASNGGSFQAGAGDRFFISGGYTSMLSLIIAPTLGAKTFNVGAAEVHFIGGGIHSYRALPTVETFPVMIIDAGNTLSLTTLSFAPSLADRGVVTITANGSATVSALSGTGTATVGSGTIAATLRVDNLSLSSVVINNLGTLRLGSGTAIATTTASLSSLTLNTGAKLDVNEKLTVNYGTNASPIAFIRQRIGLASAGGSWIGNSGITSTFAASHQPHYGLADTDGADGLASGAAKGQVLVRPALWGDVNFDGKVNAADIAQITARGHFNDLTGNHNWIDGDMDYDGVITSSDLRQIALSGNYSGPPAPVPADAAATAIAAAVGTPTYAYNPVSGDVTFLTNGVTNIVDLHLVSLSQQFIPAHSTFTGLATKMKGELESTLFGSTFGDGFDLGTVLPAGLSLAGLSNDLILRYSVFGGGSEQVAALVPEPGMIAGLMVMGWVGRRRKRNVERET
jgi:hypothetical protein